MTTQSTLRLDTASSDPRSFSPSSMSLVHRPPTPQEAALIGDSLGSQVPGAFPLDDEDGESADNEHLLPAIDVKAHAQGDIDSQASGMPSGSEQGISANTSSDLVLHRNLQDAERNGASISMALIPPDDQNPTYWGAADDTVPDTMFQDDSPGDDGQRGTPWWPNRLLSQYTTRSAPQTSHPSLPPTPASAVPDEATTVDAPDTVPADGATPTASGWGSYFKSKFADSVNYVTYPMSVIAGKSTRRVQSAVTDTVKDQLEKVRSAMGTTAQWALGVTAASMALGSMARTGLSLLQLRDALRGGPDWRMGVDSGRTCSQSIGCDGYEGWCRDMRSSGGPYGEDRPGFMISYAPRPRIM